MPFSAVAGRSKKQYREEDKKTIIAMHAFDLMYLNGESLLKKSFRERRKLLHDTFYEVKGHFHFAKYKDATEFAEVE